MGQSLFTEVLQVRSAAFQVFGGLVFLLKRQNEGLVTRYVEVASRVSALVAGTIAVEMIFTGLETWLKKS